MRSGTSLTRVLLGTAIVCALAAPTTQAGLVYEVLNGASLIYDSTTGVTWTQNANLSGQSYTNQSDAEAWAAGLTTAGLQWTLPSANDFTSLYTQLDPYGPPGSTSNKYGTTVAFGTGPNDYASNVQMAYWTNAPDTDFNFNYGYPGVPSGGIVLYAWAVDETAPPPSMVPEPGSVVLVLSGLVGIGLAQRTRSRMKRARV